MIITPFSLFLIIVIIKKLSSTKNIHSLLKSSIILTLSVMLNVRMGYFFNYKNSIVTYSTILVFFTSLLSVVYLLSKRIISKKVFVKYLYLILALVIGIITFFFIPYNHFVIKGDWTEYVLGKKVTSFIVDTDIKWGYYIRIMLCGLILIAYTNFFDYKETQSIIQSVIKYSKINIVLGFVELFMRNVFKSKIMTDIYIFIFGTAGAQQNWLMQRGLLYPIQGMTKEASMFTTVIFYIAVLLILDVDRKNQNLKWLISCFVLLVFNPALSSVAYILMLILVLYTTNIRESSNIFVIPKRKAIVLFGIPVFCVYLLFFNFSSLLNSDNYILERIGRFVQQIEILINEGDDLTYSSESIRLSGIFYDLKMLMKRPLFGFGLGVLTCNSGIVSLIVGSGLIGFLCWYNFIYSVCFKNRLSMKYILFFAEILLLPNILLNDLETIFNLIIPFSAILFYEYSMNVYMKGEVNAKRKTINYNRNIDIQEV